MNGYVEGVDFDSLAANIEKQDAILRRITIISEATNRLSKDFRQNHLTIPWKDIAGMRDVITHDYDEVDLDEVWTVRDLQINKIPSVGCVRLQP